MNGFQRYLSKEIGIEFKACLYFYCILLFYCVYQVVQGSMEANIPIMAEMILSTYIMGYIQVYLLRNFDEADRIDRFGVLAALFCSTIYTTVSYLGNWFDRNSMVTGIFYLFLLLCYLCGFLVYKVKRDIDTKQLNEDLEQFKRNKKS